MAIKNAWQNGGLDTHCIFDGLLRHHPQCREALLVGLRGGPVGTDVDLRQASEAAVLIGYAKGLSAAVSVFVDGYRQLILATIQEQGVANGHEVEDICASVIGELDGRLRKGLCLTDATLATYVRQATRNACGRAGRRARARPEAPTDPADMALLPHEAPANAGGQIIARKAVEEWEDLVSRVRGPESETRIKRVILAYDCIEGQTTGERSKVADMRRDWACLAGLPETELRLLYDRVDAAVQPLRPEDSTLAVARVINDGVIGLAGLVVALAACEQMGVRGLMQLLSELKALSDGQIYAYRIRLYRGLQ